MADDDAGSDQGDEQDKKPSYQLRYVDAKRSVPFVFREGKGTATFLNRDTYTGEYKFNRRHGKGVYVWAASGARYDGDYVFGMRDGVGTMTYPNGARYQGSWRRNQRQGQGTYTYPNGDMYCGHWDADVKNGAGTYLVAANRTQISGEWVNGRCPNGTWEFFDGQPFFGVFSGGHVVSYSRAKEDVERFHAAAAKELATARTALLNRVFDAYDDDRNRWLSLGELHAFCKLMDPTVNVTRLFGLIDVNGDRRIDRKEFVAFGLKMAAASAQGVAGVGGNTDQFALAMKLALAGKPWLKRSAERAEAKHNALIAKMNSGGGGGGAGAAGGAAKDGKAGDAKGAAAAAEPAPVSFCAESALAADVDPKHVARIDAILRTLALPGDPKQFEATAVKALLLAMNDDIKDPDAFVEASIKKWGGTPYGFADILLQSVLDGNASGGVDDETGKPVVGLLDQAELAISRVQAAAGVLTAHVQARIDSVVRFVSAEDGARPGFDLTRVRAWVNEIEDDIAGDADVAQLVTKIFGADPSAFKASLVKETLAQRSLAHLEQVEDIVAALRTKLGLPGGAGGASGPGSASGRSSAAGGALIDASVLARVDALAGMLTADPLPPSVPLAELLAPPQPAAAAAAGKPSANGTSAAAGASAGAEAKATTAAAAAAADEPRKAYNPVTLKAWIVELDEDAAANPDTAVDDAVRDWGKDPAEFRTRLVRRLELARSLDALEAAERAAQTVRARLKIPTEEEKVRARDKQRQLERDETDDDDSLFPDLTGGEWSALFTLWVAARVGSLAGVARLLAAAGPAALPLVVNQKDQSGFTPLYYALLCGHIRCAKLLLEKGALWDFRCYLATSKLSLKNLLKTAYARQRVIEGSKAKPQNPDDDDDGHY